MPTQQGLPVEEEQRLVERAKRFYEDELMDQLIDEHKVNGDVTIEKPHSIHPKHHEVSH